MALDGYKLRGGTLRVTLHCAGELLGLGEVLAEPSLRPSDRVVWSGPFRPSAAFASVRPLFAEQQALLADFQQLVQGLAEITSSDAIRSVLLADTTVRPALDAVKQRIEALHVEVRDEAGAVLPDVIAVITHIDLLRDHVPSAAGRAELRAEAARQRIPVSGYTVTLRPRRAANLQGQDRGSREI